MTINDLVLQSLNEGIIGDGLKRNLAPFAMMMALPHGYTSHFDAKFNNDTPAHVQVMKKNNLKPVSKVIGDKILVRKQDFNLKNNLANSNIG